MIRLTAHSTDDTRGIAQAIAKLVRAGDMIVLIGEMGSGKTTFSQYFAHALGVSEPVTSPTFNLLHNYSCANGALHRRQAIRHVSQKTQSTRFGVNGAHWLPQDYSVRP